jgi:hypothetical protein
MPVSYRRCLEVDRHRNLLELVRSQTNFFEDVKKVLDYFKRISDNTNQAAP